MNIAANIAGDMGLDEERVFRWQRLSRSSGRGVYPLDAWIIAVADSFDAMVANRPYRKGLGVMEAAQELVRCAGTQFDPAIVDCFCSRINGLVKDPAVHASRV